MSNDSNTHTAHRYLSTIERPETRKAYFRGISLFLDFWGGRPLSEVRALDVDAWVETVPGGESTKALRWGAVRLFFAWMVRCELLSTNPFDLAARPARTETVTTLVVPSDGDVRRMLSVNSGDLLRDARDAAAAGLLANGLRPSEVLALEWIDVNDDGTTVVLSVPGGRGCSRRLPLSAFSARLLTNWWTLGRPHGTWVFGTLSPDEPLSARQLGGAVERLAKVAGVPPVTPKDLRTHYATRLIRAGINVFALAELLGLESVEATRAYFQPAVTDLPDAAKLDTFLEGASEPRTTIGRPPTTTSSLPDPVRFRSDADEGLHSALVQQRPNHSVETPETIELQTRGRWTHGSTGRALG